MGFFQQRITVGVIKGQLGGKKKSIINIFIEKDPGVVKISKRLYYFLGVSEKSYEEVSGSKALTGAAVGMLFSPVGALIGGAIGARKKEKTHYTLAFMDAETKKKEIIEVKLPDISRGFKKLQIHPVAKEFQIEEDSKDKVSAPEQIREFKKLLDENIITEDEFNKKKLELLG